MESSGWTSTLNGWTRYCTDCPFCSHSVLLKLSFLVVPLKVIESEKMPLRIRFMVQDVVDLRRNKWATRRAGKDLERGPRTIQQVAIIDLQDHVDFFFVF